MKTENEVEEMIGQFADKGVNFHGMSYKEGVETALRWVLGEMSDNEFLTGDE